MKRRISVCHYGAGRKKSGGGKTDTYREEVTFTENISEKEERKEGYASQKLAERLGRLAEAHRFVRCQTVGRSLCGRNIRALFIGCGEKRLLYTGAHHGSEYITSALLCDFAEEFASAADMGGRRFGVDCRDVLERRTLVILPMVNPDGVDIALMGADKNTPLGAKLWSLNKNSGDFSHWQANARGVDPNHNYNYRFAEYKQLEKRLGIQPGASGYSGEYPESEPETLAVARLVNRLSAAGAQGGRLCAVLSFHTQGEVIFSHNTRECIAGAAFLSRVSGYRDEKTDLGAAGLTGSYGGLSDWVSRELLIPAYTVECGKGKNPLPQSDRGYIYARIREMLFLSAVYF